MVLLRAYMLFVSAVALVPGVGELVEDGVHLAVDGHTDHGEHEDACPEHGCAPTAHHCSCCTSLSVAASTPAVDVAAPRASGDLLAWPAASLDRPGFARRLLRPPTV